MLSLMNGQREIRLTEIERLYPNQWVLVEETKWDDYGNPVRGIVRAHQPKRKNLDSLVKEIHLAGKAKTFVFYTGELIPEDLSLAL